MFIFIVIIIPEIIHYCFLDNYMDVNFHHADVRQTGSNRVSKTRKLKKSYVRM